MKHDLVYHAFDLGSHGVIISMRSRLLCTGATMHLSRYEVNVILDWDTEHEFVLIAERLTYMMERQIEKRALKRRQWAIPQFEAGR